MKAARLTRSAAAVFLFSIWLLLAAVTATQAAEALVAVPPLQGRVTDLTGTLTPDQTAGLEQKLRAFETKKGTQLAVLIVATTQPEAIEPYGLRVVEQWKLGRKKVDDGALLLIAKNDRTVRIEVGYGIEGVLNDITAKRIVREVIAPRLKAGDYYGGVSAGVEQMIRVIDGEPLPQPSGTGAGLEGGSTGQWWPALFVLALVVGGVLRTTVGRIPGALVTGGVLALLGWLVAGAAVAGVVAGVIGFFITLVGFGMRGHGGLYGGGFYGGMGMGGHAGGGFGGGGASGSF